MVALQGQRGWHWCAAETTCPQRIVADQPDAEVDAGQQLVRGKRGLFLWLVEVGGLLKQVDVEVVVGLGVHAQEGVSGGLLERASRLVTGEVRGGLAALELGVLRRCLAPHHVRVRLTVSESRLSTALSSHSRPGP